MKLVVFDDYRIGVLDDERIRDVSELLPLHIANTKRAMTHLIAHFDELRPAIEGLRVREPPIPMSAVTLLPPVPSPTHIFAAPLNYRTHIGEMDGSDVVDGGFEPSDAMELGFFLKAPGSLVGASGAIELPDLPGRVFHHEPELCVVVGRSSRAIPPEQALGHVFGYTCLLDITLRNSPSIKNERTMRKSFETFTPTGPVLVTADEIEDVGNLDIELSVNGRRRQYANTTDLIASVPKLLSDASRVLTLQPGDLFATGTPAGVGPIVPGDTITMRIERIGELTMPVRLRSW